MMVKILLILVIFFVAVINCADKDDRQREKITLLGELQKRATTSESNFVSQTKRGDKRELSDKDDATDRLAFLGARPSARRDKREQKAVGKSPAQHQTSLVVVFDGTLSMFDDLQQLKSGAKMIINEISARQSNPIYNYIFVPYRDPAIGPKIATTDQQLFLEALDEMEIYGGGDCPESALRGIEMALESALPKPFVFVFTDAIANDHSYEPKILQLIQTKQATMTFLLTGFCNSKSEPGYKIYEKMAEASNGQVFDLNKKDIEQVLVYVKDMLDTRHVPLKILKSETGAVGTHELQVDDTLKELYVSVAGQKPEITVLSPSNESHGNKTVEVDNLKVINVHEPESGKWNIKTQSDSKHSVRISGLSDLTFDFGFSLNQVKDINETSYTPMLGRENIITVQAIGDDFEGKFDSVKITIPGTKDIAEFSFKLPLEQQKDHGLLFKTPPFHSPRAPFQLSIEGNDGHGHPIERILSTLIKSAAESPPEIFFTEFSTELNVGDNFEMICLIKSLDSVEGKLSKDGSILDSQESSSNIKFAIQKIAEITDSGNYTCSGQNYYGSLTKEVEIKVTNLVFKVDIPENIITVPEGMEELKIPCLSSESQATIQWIFNNSIIKDDDNFNILNDRLIIKNVNRYHSGIIECRGAFKTKTSNDFSILDILFPVEVIPNAPEIIDLKFGEFKRIPCPIIGNPKPEIIWEGIDQAKISKNEIIIEKATSMYDNLVLTCQGSNSVSGKSLRHEYHLKINPQSAPKTEIIQNNRISHGKEGVFSCVCSNCIPIEESFWTVDGIPIDASEHTGLYLVTNIMNENLDQFTLELRIKSLISSTNISCVLENDLGAQESSYYVQMDTPPYIKRFRVDTLTNPSKFALFSIDCYSKFDQKPSDKVIHFQDGEFQTNDHFFCDLSNRINQNVSEVSMELNLPMDFNSPEVEIKVVHSLPGTSVALVCEADGSPSPNLQWRHNFSPLSESSSKLIANISDENNGFYECRAQNTLGSSSKFFFIRIYEPPRARKSELTTLQMRRGDGISLHCDVIGFPSPTITWKHEDLHLKETQPDLKLQNMSTSMEGTYSCEGENTLGKTRKDFLIQMMKPPKIIEPKVNEVKIRPNEELVLFCQATGIPEPSVFWMTKGSVINHQPNLTLQYEQLSANSEFICRAQNSEGEASFEVKIVKGSPIVKLEVEPNIEIEFDESETLICPYEGADSYAWFKDDSKIEYEDFESLSIFSATKETSGLYRCESQFGDEFQSFTFNVTISSPQNVPVIKDLLSETTLNHGDLLNITCEASGIPPPTVRWMKKNHRVSDNEILLIVHVDLQDSGVYKCIAENSVGKIEKEVNVKIMTPPQFDGELEQFKIVKIGEKVRLSCPIQGNPPPLITWIKDGKVISKASDLFLSITSDFETGPYYCEGSNNLGRKEIKFNLILYQIPEILSLTELQIVPENKSLLLSCTSQGYPTPIMAWLKNGKRFLATSRIYFNDNLKEDFKKSGKLLIDHHGNGYSSNKVHRLFPPKTTDPNHQYGILSMNNSIYNFTLVIPHIQSKHSGNYECLSLNSLGSSNKTTEVKVIQRPKLLSENFERNLQIIEGLPIVLQCPVDKQSKPAIYWLHNEIKLSVGGKYLFKEGGRELIVTESSRQDHGHYQCIAKTVLGTIQLNFTVNILLPPFLVQNRNNLEDTTLQKDYHIVDESIREIRIAENESLSIVCPIDGNPRPEIYWFEVFYEPKFVKEFLRIQGPVLDLHSITYSRNFLCSANNTIGEYEVLFEVMVESSPKFVQPRSENITVKLFSSLILSCRITGNPTPEILWYKNGKHLKLHSNMRYSFDQQILKITNAKREASGIYTCLARNKLGSATKSFTVEVQVPVIWTPWAPWSDCSARCGVGSRKRQRSCIYLNGENVTEIDRKCRGSEIENEECLIVECPVNGAWGKWGEWGPCSATCMRKSNNSQSLRYRYRECNSPAPAFGGESCIGPNRQQEICDVPFCPIHGGWSPFSDWSPCSQTCGEGMRIRSRICDNPAPKFNGDDCKGDPYQVQKCNEGTCEVQLTSWSDWGPWSACSKSCGQGVKTRSRICKAEDPCIGENIEIEQCEEKKCSNSELVKSGEHQRLLSPLMTFDVYPIDSESKEVTPRTKDIVEATGMTHKYKDRKITVTVEQLIPLTNDITDIHFNANSLPMKMVCSPGFILDDHSNSCIDFNECLEVANICSSEQICVNTQGSYSCECLTGYESFQDNKKCIDIDECFQEIDMCSHYCENNPGGYRCSCPTGFKLSDDKKTCTPVMEERLDLQDVATSERYLTTKSWCPEGFHFENGLCEEVDECASMEDNCDVNELCLNTKGSYSCIPISCPAGFLDFGEEFSGNCIKFCNETECEKGNPKIAHTISHSILPVKDINLESPLLKLVSYDIQRRALDKTQFSFANSNDGIAFHLEGRSSRQGIVYLYANKNIQKDIVYNITVIGNSYDEHYSNLLYVHNYNIYLYIF